MMHNAHKMLQPAKDEASGSSCWPQKSQKGMVPKEDAAGLFFDPCIADVAPLAYHIGCHPSSREEGSR